MKKIIYKISIIFLVSFIKNFGLLGMEVPKQGSSNDPVICCVCRIVDCEKDENKMIILPCSPFHVFHKSCLNGWLKINPTCPLCRTQFSPKIIKYLHEHDYQEIEKIQKIIGVVNLEIEKDIELKKAFLKEIEDFKKIMQNMPRGCWEHLTEPKSSSDWICRGCVGCVCGSLLATCYAGLEVCLFHPKLICISTLFVNAAILTIETTSYNQYDFNNIDKNWPMGMVMNFYHSMKCFNQALKESAREQSTFILHYHEE